MFNITKETVMQNGDTFKFFIINSVKKQNKVFTVDNILDELDKLGVLITGTVIELVENELNNLVYDGIIKKKSSHYTLIK